MANVDRPNGFKPAKSLLGSPWNALIRRYTAGDRSADTTNNHGDIYLGDPVKLVSGLVLPANSGDTILGVVVGIGTDSQDHGEPGAFDADNLEKRYLAYNESGYVFVVPAEGVLFEAQTATGVTAANFIAGYQCDITTDAAEAHGSRTTSQSIAEIAPPVNNDIEIVETVTTPDNDLTLVNARYLVQFVTTQHAQ